MTRVLLSWFLCYHFDLLYISCFNRRVSCHCSDTLIQLMLTSFLYLLDPVVYSDSLPVGVKCRGMLCFSYFVTGKFHPSSEFPEKHFYFSVCVCISVLCLASPPAGLIDRFSY